MKKHLIIMVAICCTFLLSSCQRQAEQNGAVQSETGASIYTGGLAEKDAADEEIMDRIFDDSGTTYNIDSAIASLSYPDKWKDFIETEQTDNAISFFGMVPAHDRMLLFTLEFGESDGYLLGTLNGTDISIVEGTLEFDDSWSEAEREEIYAMQEDVNVILQGLIETEGFVIAG